MCECRDGTEWGSTRTWSQSVLDKLEDGEIEWERDDTKIDTMLLKEIQKNLKANRDTKTYVKYEKNEQDHLEKAYSQQERRGREVKQKPTSRKICTNWNRGECEEKTQHQRGKLMWIQNCSSCIEDGYNEDHKEKYCPWKTKATYDCEPRVYKRCQSRSESRPPRSSQGEFDDQNIFSKN